MKTVLSNNVILLLFALVLCLPVAAASWGIASISTEVLLRRDAGTTAKRWASYIRDNAANFKSALRGEPHSADTVAFLKQAHNLGPVVEFELFSWDGTLHMRSESPEGLIKLLGVAAATDNLFVRRPWAKPQLERGETLIDLRPADDMHEEGFETEVIVPLVFDGSRFGHMLIEIDQNENWLAIRDLSWTYALGIGLTLSALPMFLTYLLWRKRQENATLKRLSEIDLMTGLLNRGAIYGHMARLTAPDAPVQTIAVHFIDLDSFKILNDTRGHDVGDAILREIGKRLGGLATGGCMVARLGGDEFLVVQSGVGRNEDAAALADAIRSTILRPVAFGLQSYCVGCSIGVAIAETNNCSADDLTLRADTALYEAKAKGSHSTVLFDAVLEQRMTARCGLEREILDAIAGFRFELYYQPIISTIDSRLCGFEALIRMHRADGSLAPPDLFIEVAERTGRIDEIGVWGLNDACRTAADWPGDYIVAVNLSPSQFRSGRLVEAVRNALALSGLPPWRLELEITEGTMLNDSEYVLEQIYALRSLGVSIALDDFGTGYSSLSYLWRFPLNKLKIDKSFVHSMDSSASARRILGAITELGRQLGFKVTAEGVETRQQLLTLVELGCELAQGYLFGRPAGAHTLATLMSRDMERRS